MPLAWQEVAVIAVFCSSLMFIGLISSQRMQDARAAANRKALAAHGAKLDLILALLKDIAADGRESRDAARETERYVKDRFGKR